MTVIDKDKKKCERKKIFFVLASTYIIKQMYSIVSYYPTDSSEHAVERTSLFTVMQ